MQPQGENDYKQLLTEVIKKQIVILGPDITLLKARNVSGLTVADDGTVTAISGEPQQITQSLIDQFVQLSGLIVKKTMEPLLSYHPEGNKTEPAKPDLTGLKPMAPPATPDPVMPPTPAVPSVSPLLTPPVNVSPEPSQDSSTMPVHPNIPTPNLPDSNGIQPGPTPIPPASSPMDKPVNAMGTSATPTDVQHTDQIDTETQKIINEALKTSE